MIHWLWLILAFICGGSFGAVTMSLFVMSGNADTAIEESSRTDTNGESSGI